MKKYLHFAIVVLLVSADLIYSQNEPEYIAVINKVIKEVFFKTDDPNWKKAVSGITLQTDNQIRTGERSLAVISFLDGSVLRVREKSEVIISGKKTNKTINKETYIKQGVIGFKVRNQENEEFRFTTPTMVASIRGTEGYFEIKNSLTILIVEEGIVEISPRDINTVQMVTAGFTGIINLQGNVEIRETSELEKQKLIQSKKIGTSLLELETEEDLIEFEIFQK